MTSYPASSCNTALFAASRTYTARSWCDQRTVGRRLLQCKIWMMQTCLIAGAAASASTDRHTASTGVDLKGLARRGEQLGFLHGNLQCIPVMLIDMIPHKAVELMGIGDRFHAYRDTHNSTTGSDQDLVEEVEHSAVKHAVHRFVPLDEAMREACGGRHLGVGVARSPKELPLAVS